MNNMLSISATDFLNSLLKDEQKNEVQNIVNKLLNKYNLNSYDWYKVQLYEFVCSILANNLTSIMFSHQGFQDEQRNKTISMIRNFADSEGIDAVEFIEDLN